ncbi:MULTISPECIES: hypothetical protein [unclassified Mesorhizobium]|uniref:hypothetical protein n=1 Tax=unclassified Mesorhizobium TaxID=325217 RepID=UPI003337D6D3
MSGKFADLAIAGGIAVLALINVALYNTPIDTTPIASGKGHDGGPASAAGTLQFPEAGDFSETFQRPLFTPMRRKIVPPPPAPLPVEVAVAPVEQAPAPVEVAPVAAPSLLGISIQGGAGKALLRVAGKDEALWYASGEIVDGWTVSVIDKDQAVLERDGKVTRIPLHPPWQNPLPAPPPAPAPPPPPPEPEL